MPINCKDCGLVHDTTNPHCGRSYTVHGRPLAPHTCPVCNGAQTVPAGFYTQNMDGMWSGSGAGDRETCRSCSGTGVVWG